MSGRLAPGPAEYPGHGVEGGDGGPGSSSRVTSRVRLAKLRPRGELGGEEGVRVLPRAESRGARGHHPAPHASLQLPEDDSLWSSSSSPPPVSRVSQVDTLQVERRTRLLKGSAWCRPETVQPVSTCAGGGRTLVDAGPQDVIPGGGGA